MIQKSYDHSASLYLIPTPIGNLEDITIRSLKMLEFVDVVLCEDTRTTGILLSHFDIKKKLLSCHEYNEDKMISTVINLLMSGKQVGLVTDQGTPIISDPGFILVKALIEKGYNVIGLPGATAFVPALISSGIEPSPFLFYGFLNSKSGKQREELDRLKNIPYTIIFYEAVHRMKKTLENMLEFFGNRRISISREISKIHEEIRRGTIVELLDSVDQLKGEFVIIVEGNKEKVAFDKISIIEHVKLFLNDGLTEMDAIKQVAKERGVSKSIIYNEYHKNK